MNTLSRQKPIPGLEQTDCPNCGATESTLLFEIEDYLYGVGGRFGERRCDNCGLVFLSPRPSRRTIGDYYPPSYSPYRPAIQDERSIAMRWMRRRKLVKRREAVERHAARTHTAGSPGHLLDFGCSTGIFMDEMRTAGWRVTGVELVHEAAAYARHRFGLDVIEGDLLEVGLASGAFDVVTLFDVLEHTFEPGCVLRRVWHLLRPGGIVALTLPNWESLDHALFGKYWVGYDAPRHLAAFPHNVLVDMLQQAGFRVEEDRCLFGGYFTFVTSLRTWLRARAGPVAAPAESLIDFPGLRLPFEPFFMLMDRRGAGGIRFLVARKPEAPAMDRNST